MQKASNLINRAHLFSKLHFWKKQQAIPEAPSGPISFTKHMVSLVAKLVLLRGSDGTEEFKALCKVFRLALRVRKKLLMSYLSAIKDPLPAEYHARQIGKLYSDKRQREEVLERLIRIAAISHSFIGRDEYHLLRSIAQALELSRGYFFELCARYEIEIPTDNPYKILGVSRLDSKTEIKRKYYRLVREYHPDSLSGEGFSTSEAQAFSQKLAEINQAYNTLKEAA